MTKTYRTRVAGCGVSALLLLAATPAFAQGKPLDFTIIESTPSVTDTAALVLQDMAPSFNMKINLIAAQGGGAAGQVFVGGAGDIMLGGFDAAASLLKQGLLDVRVTATLLNTMGWYLETPADSNIKTLADLKGKNVGISGPGALSELALFWALRNAGVDPNTVSRVALGNGLNLAAALENHKLDAATVSVPQADTLPQRGVTRILANWGAVRYPNDVFVARTKDLRARNDDFIRFHKLLIAALTKMKSDRAYTLKMMRVRAPATISDDDLEKTLDFLLKNTWSPMDGVLTEADYDNSVDIWLKSGRFKADEIPSYKALVDNYVLKN